MGRKQRKQAEAEREVEGDEPTEAQDASAIEPEVEVVNEESEVERLARENAELKDTLLRQRADFENARKRMRREADEAGNRAIARFVRPVLTELDNFELAIQSAKPEQFEDFALGVTMIKSNLEGVLSGSGIEKVPAEGVFDPAQHEVVQEVEDAERARGEIVQVLRSGYRLGDQLIRAAQVMVARPPRAEAPSEAEAGGDAGEGEEAQGG